RFGLGRRQELGFGRKHLRHFLGSLRIERAELDGLGYRLYHLGGHRRFELERWLWNLSGLLRLERGLRHFWCRGLRSGKGRDRGGGSEGGGGAGAGSGAGGAGGGWAGARGSGASCCNGGAATSSEAAGACSSSGAGEAVCGSAVRSVGIGVGSGGRSGETVVP